jgi:hypothetical protein
MSPALLPPARFSWSATAYHGGYVKASRGSPGLVPNPGWSRGPENVPCRAVFIQLQRAVVPKAPVRLPGSNPFLTHGTVESPTNFSLTVFQRTENRRFQSVPALARRRFS